MPAAKMPAWRRSPGRAAVVGMAAACVCLLLAFSFYGKRLPQDMRSGQQELETDGDAPNSGNPEEGIQTLNLGGDTENPIDATGWPAGQQKGRAVQAPELLFGTIQSYTEGTGDALAVLCLETEGFEAFEIYVTCGGEFAPGEEVALILVIEADTYYLEDFGQKYKKGGDGLYYNTFGEVLPEDIGEIFPEGIGG